MTQNVRPTDNVLFRADTVSFINLRDSLSGEEFLQKSQCSSYIVLALILCWHGLSYVTSSSNLKNEIFTVIRVYSLILYCTYCYIGLYCYTVLYILFLSAFLNSGSFPSILNWRHVSALLWPIFRSQKYLFDETIHYKS